jgi:hypothetical protein
MHVFKYFATNLALYMGFFNINAIYIYITLPRDFAPKVFWKMAICMLMLLFSLPHCNSKSDNTRKKKCKQGIVKEIDTKKGQVLNQGHLL